MVREVQGLREQPWTTQRRCQTGTQDWLAPEPLCCHNHHKTQPMSCFCPPCPRTSPKNEWARAQPSVCPGKGHRDGQRDQGRRGPSSQNPAGLTAQPRQARGILTGSEKPLVTCPNASLRRGLLLGSHLLQSASVPGCPDPQCPFHPAAMYRNRYRDPGALEVPVIRRLYAGQHPPSSASVQKPHPSGHCPSQTRSLLRSKVSQRASHGKEESAPQIVNHHEVSGAPFPTSLRLATPSTPPPGSLS